MATSLAAQLAKIAAKSTNSLNLRAQKAAHGQSLIFEPSVAATQDFDSLYTLCAEGFEEICLLDRRFAIFRGSIFSQQSKTEDRTQMTEKENEQLNIVLEDFMGLVGARLLLKPAIMAVEWLVRRFRIHEYNTRYTLVTFLPYHTAPLFVTLMSILPNTIPDTFNFLRPYIRSLTNPVRHAIVYSTIRTPSLAAALNNYVLRVSKMGHHHHALLAFWAGIMTEAVAGMMDKARSGRSNVQSQNQEDVLLRVLPLLNEGLMMKKIPDFRIGCYMIITVLVNRASLEERVLISLMEAIAGGWTKDSLTPALTCMALLSQSRSVTRLSKAIVRETLKIDSLLSHLRALHQRYRVDSLTLGLSLGACDRLAKVVDGNELAFIGDSLSSGLLTDLQIKLVLKALLTAAQSIGSEANDAEDIRKLSELIGRLSSHTQLESHLREIIEEDSIDIDALEMKLQVLIRPGKGEQEEGETDDIEMADSVAVAFTPLTYASVAANLLSRTTEEISLLSNARSHLFPSLLQAFLVATLNPSDLVKFTDLPLLRKGTAMTDTFFFSFFIRVWSGPYPVMARSAALTLVAKRLTASSTISTDLQAFTPYLISALADPAAKVRSAAADLLVVLIAMQDDKKKSAKATEKIWGEADIYGLEKVTNDVRWMAVEQARRFSVKVLSPALEECVLDAKRIGQVLRDALRSTIAKNVASKDSQNTLKSADRTALMYFLSSHAIYTPLYTVKCTLLSILNGVTKVHGTSRTGFLLPLLQDQASLQTAELEERCKRERLSLEDLELQTVSIVTAGSSEGIKALQDILSGKLGSSRPSLIRSALGRIRKLWPSMRFPTTVANFLLDLSLDRIEDLEASSTLQAEALDTLRSLDLSSETLVSFVGRLKADVSALTNGSASKRRKGNDAEALPVTTQASEQAKPTITMFTIILELVDSSHAERHPDLLRGLFHALGELQKLKAQTGSEMAYLQTLALGSLTSIVRDFSQSGDKHLDRASVNAGLLTDCVGSTTSPQVQHAALLLVASLAEVAPDLILHSVMPIFTFMGSTVLRLDDEYSVHVIDQTIRQVVPPLVASLRKQDQDPVAGNAELLISFVTAFDHIPTPRRLKLFTSLLQTLGEKEFLFAVLAMLMDKYPDDAKVEAFTRELAAQFDAETQLTAARNGLELVADVLKPERKVSEALLNIGDGEDDDPASVAIELLALLARMLSHDRLVSSVQRMLERQETVEAGQKLTALFTVVLEQLLSFADTVADNSTLQTACGDVLQALLGLLSTSEFLRSVEPLLERKDNKLRRKILKALETRIRGERVGDEVARKAVLDFLPRITTTVQRNSNILLQHTAISCVDQILEKYGKKDLDAVDAAAHIVAGSQGLLHEDDRVRVISLLCLASCVEILGARFVPILPQALPAALDYLDQSIDDGTGQKSHNAAFAFLGALLLHLPWMITGPYLDRILVLAQRSAQSDLREGREESCSEVLQLLPRRVGGKECLSAVSRTWKTAVRSGPIALSAQIIVFGECVEEQAKSAMVRNTSVLGDIFSEALDLRRTVSMDSAYDFDAEEVTTAESDINEVLVKTILKMNDSTFRPIFSHLITRAAAHSSKENPQARVLRLTSVFGFLCVFFDTLKSIVTSYASYLIPTMTEVLSSVSDASHSSDFRPLYIAVLRTLTSAFSHDQDSFWQSPTHFTSITPTLLAQLCHASKSLPVVDYVIPAITELAATVDSADQHKTMNTAIMALLRHDEASVRLAAVKCEMSLTERLGEEWLALLPEMLPFVSELQEDDDEAVEREVNRWIIMMEGVLGENLDSMLQ